ncbi:MAG: ThuA domain-containing protein [Planctomycetota bacterium]
MSESPRQALIVYGGWDGHTPQACAELMAERLEGHAIQARLADSLAVLDDDQAMRRVDLIVPIWTMGEISDPQWKALGAAIHNGAGLAGFHGGMVDAFRANTEYQWMTGAQWVAHPGNEHVTYRVEIANSDHPITRGLSGFVLPNTEQYYCHHDPGNTVLCTTKFDQGHGDPSRYHQNVVMPYAWTKSWGAGRVFGAAWGHTVKDFDVPEALEIVIRGMRWACR